MLITEFIVPMPLSCQEYERGLLYSVMETSRREARRGTGIEILANEPFDNYPLLGGAFNKGQYTKKRYDVETRLPRFITRLAPKNTMVIHEESWNAFPFCRTVLTNSKMGKDFFVRIDSLYVDQNRGDWNNAHRLDEDHLRIREVVHMDIGSDAGPSSWDSPDEEPGAFKSLVTGRGPLTAGWVRTTDPVMTCYKLVTAYFKWFGLQGAVERYIVTTQYRLCLRLHKHMFCSLDDWIGLSMKRIRKMEDEVKRELSQMDSEKSLVSLRRPGPSQLTNSSAVLRTCIRKRKSLDCQISRSSKSSMRKSKTSNNS